MVRVSKYPLDQDTETEMYRKFWRSISVLRDPDDVSSFFSDFLSDAERIMLAKRFSIAVLILHGRMLKDIKDTLHVSNSAIGSVASWLKNAKPRTLQSLKRVIKEGDWDGFIDRIEALLDELPPRYGTDWHKTGKAKFQRKLERTSRQSLR
jgi:uncharacterized protein YerC